MEARESFSAAAAARPRSRTRGHTPRYETTRLQSRCRPHLPTNPKASTVVVQTKHSSINSPINHVRCGGKQSGPPVPTHIQQQKTRPDTYTAVKLSLGAPPRLCRASSALSTHTHSAALHCDRRPHMPHLCLYVSVCSVRTQAPERQLPRAQITAVPATSPVGRPTWMRQTTHTLQRHVKRCSRREFSTMGDDDDDDASCEELCRVPSLSST